MHRISRHRTLYEASAKRDDIFDFSSDKPNVRPSAKPTGTG